MSRFTFMAADRPLPEVDYSGVIKLTVKDLKAMDPRPQSFWDLDQLPDDCKAIYIPDEKETGGLEILFCTNPPYGLEAYIKKKYIYWLQGNFRLDKCRSQLLAYLQDQAHERDAIELWSLWFGNDEMERIVYHQRQLSQIESQLFELLDNTDCCLRILK